MLNSQSRLIRDILAGTAAAGMVVCLHYHHAHVDIRYQLNENIDHDICQSTYKFLTFKNSVKPLKKNTSSRLIS